MLSKVRDYIDEHHLLDKGEKIVVGVSGGADSVSLLHILYALQSQYELQLYVVHVNHKIRKEAAEQDAKFVEELCAQWNIPFILIEENVAEIAKERQISEEEAGRNIRYEAFERVCEKYSCYKVAVAHNMNDNAETILLNLFRGSAIRGLTGMKSQNGKVIRPLLCVTRNEIEEYLCKQQQEYRTDATNFVEEYTRNKIRLRVLPYVIEEVNHKAMEHINESAAYLKEVEQYLYKQTLERASYVLQKESDRCVISVADLMREDKVIQKNLVYMALQNLRGSRRNITSEHIAQVLELMDKQVGKQQVLSHKICARRTYDSIVLEKEQFVNKTEEWEYQLQKVSIPGEYQLPHNEGSLTVRILSRKEIAISKIKIPQNPCVKWYDYAKIKNTVYIRTRKAKDYMVIDTNGNKKTLKSLLIDKKIPQKERNRIPLLTEGSHVLWAIGIRNSDAYHVTNQTKEILEVTWKKR